MSAPRHAVDEILPGRKLLLFGLQHVLVMAASPITAAFLVSRGTRPALQRSRLT